MSKPPALLTRELGLPGAVGLGLGSILGTGVFVSLALAAGVAGAMTPWAVVLACGLAWCNGLSSAQLAAAHPVAGGTYAYGRRFLTPALGFSAGCLFLVAKSASAATAAMAVAGYTASLIAVPWGEGGQIAGAMGVVAGVTGVVLAGLRRTAWLNALLVTITLAALAVFVAVAWWGRPPDDQVAAAAEPADWSSLAHAAALVFVAYTGYGRIATMGEEVRDPRRIIPRAVAVTLTVTGAVYLAVITAGMAAVGPAGFAAAAEGGAPLEVTVKVCLARILGGEPVGTTAAALDWSVRSIVAIGAITAMLGVLLNLLLGLSRVALAMGRAGDLPGGLSRLDRWGKTPVAAVLAVAAVVAGLTLLGSIHTAWTFSAVTVLLYYGLTNAAALRLPPAQRLYPRAVSWMGLAGCVALAAFVPWPYLVAAGATLGLALLLRAGLRRRDVSA